MANRLLSHTMYVANPAVYAITSVNRNAVYLFPLPFVVLSWRKLGIRSLIILIGNKDDFLRDELTRFIVDILRHTSSSFFSICNYC